MVFLSDMFEIDELRDDGEFADIEEDVRDECGKFGSVVEVAIPRPRAPGDETPVPVWGKPSFDTKPSRAAAARDGCTAGNRGKGHADFQTSTFERRAF